MLEESDGMLTSSRPMALDRLGLDAYSLEARFRELVVVFIVGHSGDGRDRPGHDLTYLAASGLLAPPELPRTLIADLGGAERAVSALTSLLARRAAPGRPRRVGTWGR